MEKSDFFYDLPACIDERIASLGGPEGIEPLNELEDGAIEIGRMSSFEKKLTILIILLERKKEELIKKVSEQKDLMNQVLYAVVNEYGERPIEDGDDKPEAGGMPADFKPRSNVEILSDDYDSDELLFSAKDWDSILEERLLPYSEDYLQLLKDCLDTNWLWIGAIDFFQFMVGLRLDYYGEIYFAKGWVICSPVNSSKPSDNRLFEEIIDPMTQGLEDGQATGEEVFIDRKTLRGRTKSLLQKPDLN